MIHVGFDLLFLVPGETGGRETYARELLPAIRATGRTLRLTTFLNRETASAGDGFWTEHADRAVVLGETSGRSRPRWAAGELALLPVAAARANVDVLHSPANFGPWHSACARVITLHDVGYRARPELLGRTQRWGTEALLVPAARRAHRIITVSAASRGEIVRCLGVNADRVDVIRNGLSTPGTGDPTRARSRADAGDRPIVLSVATDLPHKNLPALVDAVGVMPAAERPLLVLVGHGTDTGSLAQRARALGVADTVRALGTVTPPELEDLYAAAALLVTSTLYEGFGLPVLEALARGVPVACSELEVLREVAGDAAVYFDPRRPEAIAAAIRATLGGGSEIERRRAEGRRRAAEFSWPAAAEATLASYNRALAAAGRGPSRLAMASA